MNDHRDHQDDTARQEDAGESATEELTEEAERAARDVTSDDPDTNEGKRGDALTPNTDAQESGEDT